MDWQRRQIKKNVLSQSDLFEIIINRRKCPMLWYDMIMDVEYFFPNFSRKFCILFAKTYFLFDIKLCINEN